MNEIDIEAINNLLDAIAQLEDLVASKDAEIAFLKERETAFVRDGIEALNTVVEALRAVRPGREADQFVRESGERINAASADDKPFLINARIKRAATMIRDAPAPVVEREGRFSYSTNTRTQNRALALVDHLKRTGKGSLKMPEARSVLETHEGRHLDRKVVWRAMKAAQGLLRATKDTVWGVSRLILKCPLERGDNEDRVTMPRPRRERVPWGG